MQNKSTYNWEWLSPNPANQLTSMIFFNLTGIIILSNLILSCNLHQHGEVSGYHSDGRLWDFRMSGVPELPVLRIELFGLLVFRVMCDGVLKHGLTVTSGIKAAREATEE